MGLTPKQRRFVAEYLIDLNATQAAIRAGYSPKAAKPVASRLLTNANVAVAVSAGKAEQLQRADLTAQRVLEEYRRIAFVDMRSFWNADGSLKPVSEWTAEQGAAVAGLEIVLKNAAAGDGVVDRVLKFKGWDKTRALESLAKHFGLLTEKVEHSGGIEISWKDSE